MLKTPFRIDRRRFLQISTGTAATLLAACEADVASTPAPGQIAMDGSAPDTRCGSATVGTSGTGGASGAGRNAADSASPDAAGGTGGTARDDSAPDATRDASPDG